MRLARWLLMKAVGTKYLLGRLGSSQHLLCSNIELLGRSSYHFSWLRYCATSRKLAGSILDGVTGIFN
jgi:hypothetical protein